MLLKFVSLWLLTSVVISKKTKASERVQITDLKDWKKELRTKKNVLALFTKVSIFLQKIIQIDIRADHLLLDHLPIIVS